MADGPLSGVSVLEFSHIYAAPYAGMHLADLGADVVKVEPPGGEAFRHSGSVVPGTSKSFQWLNRGKRSLVLDLANPRALAIVHRLVTDTDVVLINYRPGVPARLGIDYETLREIRPDLIYMDITGFGREGPWATEAASDLVAQAFSGAIAAEGKLNGDGAPESIVSLAVGDLVTGLASAMGICAALHHRDCTGEGQLVEAALVRSAMAVIGTVVNREPVADAVQVAPTMAQVDALLARGAPYTEIAEVRRGAATATTGAAFRLYYSGYVARDGALVLGALTPENRAAMRRVLGITNDPSASPDFNAFDPANVPIIEAVRREIVRTMRTRTVAEWIADFRTAGAPASPVNFGEKLFDDEQAHHYFVELEHPLTGVEQQIGPIVDMSKTPTSVARPAPILGQDSEDVLLAAGYAADEIEALVDDHVVLLAHPAPDPTRGLSGG